MFTLGTARSTFPPVSRSPPWRSTPTANSYLKRDLLMHSLTGSSSAMEANRADIKRIGVIVHGGDRETLFVDLRRHAEGGTCCRVER